MKKLAKGITKKIIKMTQRVPPTIVGGFLVFSGITFFFLKNYRVKITIKKKWKKGDPYVSLFEEFNMKEKNEK